MRKLLKYGLWLGIAALIVYLWRRAIDVKATVTIPLDELVVKSHSITPDITVTASGDQSSPDFPAAGGD